MTRSVRALPASDFGPAEAAAWRSLRANAPVYRSPFFAPEYIAAIGSVRSDVHIAFLESDGQPKLGFAYHRRPGGFLRPLGAPWSDWQGPIMAAHVDIDPGELLDVCGGHAIRFTTLADPFDRFRSGRERTAGSWYMDFSDGAVAYRAALEEAQKSNLVNTRRVTRKAEREIGPVRFTMNDPDREAFAQLIRWKRERFAAEGSYDILSVAWVDSLMNRLWEARTEPFGGCLSTVRFGDRLAAATFHLRDRNQWVSWIMGYDPDLGAYGPGRILIDQFIAHVDVHGVRSVEFGGGGDDYKSKWCLAKMPVHEALWHGRRWSARMRASAWRGWGAASRVFGPANSVLRRVRSRTDHICSIHPRWADAARGLVVSALGRRPNLA